VAEINRRKKKKNKEKKAEPLIAKRRGITRMKISTFKIKELLWEGKKGGGGE